MVGESTIIGRYMIMPWLINLKKVKWRFNPILLSRTFLDLGCRFAQQPAATLDPADALSCPHHVVGQSKSLLLAISTILGKFP
jgi:hypothetical protein